MQNNYNVNAVCIPPLVECYVSIYNRYITPEYNVYIIIRWLCLRVYMIQLLALKYIRKIIECSAAATEWDMFIPTVCIYVVGRRRSRTCSLACVYKNVHFCTYSCVYAHRRAHTCTHLCTRQYTRVYVRTRTHTRTHSSVTITTVADCKYNIIMSYITTNYIIILIKKY